MNIDWKWLIIGLILGYFGVPMIMGVVSRAKVKE